MAAGRGAFPLRDLEWPRRDVLIANLYRLLQTPTAAEQELLLTYDKTGSIPFRP
jgi:hypothetical protein